MQKYKEINGNDYVKDSRTTINETMQSIQSMNSGTAFPTNNLFEGMKCYRTDLKKTYTLTDVENNTWVEDAHATLSDEATHAATATKVVTKAATGASANIAEATMAANDLARIRVSGETNAGELALETADNGSEPIVARQYTGIYETPVRTAKILDESGNTSFPGTVVAPKFTGSLNGNAATATKLQTPRTLSLTGKAAGSATFDGSANASINVTSVNADTASKLSTARKINITGNATGSASFDGSADANISVTVNESKHAVNADVASNVSGKIYYSADSPSVATDKLFTVKQAHRGEDNVPNNGLVIQTGPAGANYNGKLYITNNGNDGVWIGGVLEGKEVGWTRLVENKGSWNINSATATKLATARAISLTGNASGSANFDGSGNVSINTTVNESKHAAAADALNSMGNKTAIKDGTREPLNLSLYKVYDNGYPVPYGNLLSIGGAGGGELLAEWSGEHKGIGHLYYRNRRDTGNLWSDWCTVAFTSDINSFAPTKTGGGASGTWGINISGNADSATNADKLDGYHASDIINRISAANTGGIVAASLTENGYVKFANGLILQWGNASGKKEDEEDNSTTFPIAFPSTCFVVLLTSKRYIVPNRLFSQSKTDFTWTAKCRLISWAALGM